jgi:hypothetical protein
MSVKRFSLEHVIGLANTLMVTSVPLKTTEMFSGLGSVHAIVIFHLAVYSRYRRLPPDHHPRASHRVGYSAGL